MNFSIDNQKENNISRTTTQTVQHKIYNNINVTISGMNNLHSVWLKTPVRHTRKHENLTIEEAVKVANKMIASEPF